MTLAAAAASSKHHHVNAQIDTPNVIDEKKREKNRKKRAKMREKDQLAENEKESWQSFANQKGLKGLPKKSIFSSPH